MQKRPFSTYLSAPKLPKPLLLSVDPGRLEVRQRAVEVEGVIAILEAQADESVPRRS